MRTHDLDVVTRERGNGLVRGAGRELEHALEPSRRVEQQHPRRRRFDRERVRQVAREEDERARLIVIGVLADVERDLAVEQVVPLVSPLRRLATEVAAAPKRMPGAAAPAADGDRRR